MPGPIPKNADEAGVEGGTIRKRNRHANPAFGTLDEKTPAPEMLGKIGSEKWKLMLGILVKAGIVQNADHDTLLAYCIAYESLDYWTQKIKTLRELESKLGDGEDDLEQVVAIPKEIMQLAQRQSRALVEIQNLGGKLGANPVDRGKVKIVKKKEDRFGAFTGPKG